MNKKDLQKIIKEKLGDYRFVVVSTASRMNMFLKREDCCPRTPGGVITALICDAGLRRALVAFGNGDADQK